MTSNGVFQSFQSVFDLFLFCEFMLSATSNIPVINNYQLILFSKVLFFTLNHSNCVDVQIGLHTDATCTIAP